MKLLLVIPYFFPKIGGLENYALQISRGLQEKYKWTVVIITTNHEKNVYKEDTVFGMKVYRLPRLIKLSNTPINPFWYFSIDDIVSKEKPDIINGHTPVPFISDIAERVAYKHKIPFVLTYQNDLVKNSWLLSVLIKVYYMCMGSQTLFQAKKIIASSEYYVKNSSYLKQYAVKIDIIPPGVSLPHFSLANLDSKILHDTLALYRDKKNILFIGQLDKTHMHKGLSYLFSSLALVLKKVTNAHVTVIGKGDNISGYTNEVEKLNLQKYVSFLGFVSDEKLPYYLQACDVVVLPSYNDSEGFGMVLIEAGASKKPVIASNIGGIPSVVKNRETGFLVEPKNVQELSSAILKILTNPTLSKEMGLNNYHLVKDNFSWDMQIKKTYDVFSTII